MVCEKILLTIYFSVADDLQFASEFSLIFSLSCMSKPVQEISLDLSLLILKQRKAKRHLEALFQMLSCVLKLLLFFTLFFFCCFGFFFLLDFITFLRQLENWKVSLISFLLHVVNFILFHIFKFFSAYFTLGGLVLKTFSSEFSA